jgi:regulator of sirC expression with transglutaminase-like and TPR domain
VPTHAKEVSAHPEPGAQRGLATPDPRPALTALDPAQRRRLDATLQAALAAMVRGNLDAARAEYATAVKLAPGEPAGYRGLGLVAARVGATQEARAALHKYLVLAPRAPDAAAIRKRLAALP